MADHKRENANDEPITNASNLKQINTIEELKDFFTEFQQGELNSTEIIISAALRKPMRPFKTLFPDIHYVALGLQTTYTLRVSKYPIKITLQDVSPKSLSTFIEISNLKIPERAPRNLLSYCADLLDPYYGSKKLVDLFLDAVVHFGGEKELLSQTWDLPKRIAEHIKKNPAFKDWMEASIPDSTLACKPLHSNTNPEKGIRYSSVYVPENDREYFIAVDLKSANFQSLKESNPALVDNCANWQEFLRNFTDSEYFFQCKRFRMKCFSYCNFQKQALLDPSKQKKMWESMTKSILKNLIERSQVFTREEFAAWNSDESVFRVEEKNLEHKISKCEEALQKYFPTWQVRVSSFQLRKISHSQPFFAVLHMDGRVDFKCCNAEELPQVIKKWEQREVNENDVAINKKKVIEWE